MSLPRIALAIGDPAGIGPEIVLKALARAELRALCEPVVVGNPAVLLAQANATGMTLPTCEIVAVDDGGVPPLGRVSAEAGRACIAAATRAMQLGLEGSVAAVVAAPHNETSVAAAGIPFSGYPGLIAKVTKVSPDRVFLMLVSPHYRVVNVTLHESLATAMSRITIDLVSAAIAAALEAARRFGIARPKIGVCGLNPHAGEGGLFGDEDARLIAPAIAAWQDKDADVSGPHGADVLFGARAHDIYLAMYHDQGHIPVKVASPKSAAAMSIGTPILFSTVAHGTGYDIAGTGRADESALVNAVRLIAEQFR